MKKYWEVRVIAQSGRPGDTNPVAVFKVVTLDGERPSEGDMIGACAWANITQGRVPVFQYREIDNFAPPVKVSFKGSTSETWVIKAPFDSESE